MNLSNYSCWQWILLGFFFHLATGLQAQNVFENKEFIRNGNFDLGKAAWYVEGNDSVTKKVGKDGSAAMVVSVDIFKKNTVNLFQELYLPQKIINATVSFDYRLVPTDTNQQAQFQAGMATDKSSLIAFGKTPVCNTDSGWQHFQHSFTGQELFKLMQAKQNKKRVYLLFTLTLNSSVQGFNAYVDNVSFKMKGVQYPPQLKGKIAYVTSTLFGNSLAIMDPDGKNSKTLKTIGADYQFFDLSWSPDGEKLAFSSDYQGVCSNFFSDIYSIQKEGANLTRITNSPGLDNLDAYKTGSVTGSITNDSYSSVTLYLYVQGAKEVFSIPTFASKQTVKFTIPKVADLGVNKSQYIVCTWVNGTNLGKQFYLAGADIIPEKIVDIGTFSFNGNDTRAYATDLSWSADGKFIAYTLGTHSNGMLKKISLTGDLTGEDLIDEIGVSDVSWGPKNNWILYNQLGGSGVAGIYVTVPENAAQNKKYLIDSMNTGNPVWLPDASGFVYLEGNNLHYYLFEKNKSGALTTFYNETVIHPSVSPDGKYVVFGLKATESNFCNLWILDLYQPLEMWALTTNGKCTLPSWGKGS